MDTNVIWDTYIQMGEKAFRHGQYEVAETMLRAAIKEAPALRKEQIPLPQLLENLAEIFCKQERFLKCERQFKRTLALYMREGADNNPNVCRVLYKMARLYLIQGKFSLGELWYTRALESSKKCDALDPDMHGKWILELVKLWHNAGETTAAMNAYQEVLMLRIDMTPSFVSTKKINSSTANQESFEP